MSRIRDRFYNEVSLAGESGGHCVLLDGRPLKTPAGTPFVVPTVGLAERIAEEWRAQGTKIAPETMVLTKLANTAIDRVRPDRNSTVEQILNFAKSDLVCYRAPEPEDLVRRQAQSWDPLLQWVSAQLRAPLTCATGIAFVEQPADSLAALQDAIASHDDFSLAALHAAAALTGSAIIALALSTGRSTPEEAFQAAYLDEIYQAEQWGRDTAALNAVQKKSSELAEIERFFRRSWSGLQVPGERAS